MLRHTNRYVMYMYIYTNGKNKDKNYFGMNTVHENLYYFNKWCLQETHTMESTAITYNVGYQYTLLTRF